MWTPTRYRIDGDWAPEKQPRLFKFHREDNMMSRSLGYNQYPTYVDQMVRDNNIAAISFGVQNLGYIKSKDKLNEFDRYMHAKGGWHMSLSKLESILDKNPVLESPLYIEVS
jgi:hypothetical protein